MTYRGEVRNGAIVLDEPVSLPEGARVEVHLVGERDEGSQEPTRRRTWAERFGPLIGSIRGLPPDFAENLDHYLYGAPKRK